jgi:hypothetical protein
MNYLVHDYTKRGKVFATIEEANAYANEMLKRSGYVFAVTETKRNVTHVYEI